MQLAFIINNYFVSRDYICMQCKGSVATSVQFWCLMLVCCADVIVTTCGDNYLKNVYGKLFLSHQSISFIFIMIIIHFFTCGHIPSLFLSIQLQSLYFDLFLLDICLRYLHFSALQVRIMELT